MCIECNNQAIRTIKKEIGRNLSLKKDAIMLKNTRLIENTSRKIAEETAKLKGQYDEIKRAGRI